MAVPFLDLFNKLRQRFSSKKVEPPPAPPRLARAVRPSGDRFNRTFTPRPVATKVIGSSAQRQFAPAPRARELPPALAKALEPKLERAISLRLIDFLDQIPAEYIKPVEVIDTTRPVSLKASELEKGMPEQKPSIPLASLYQQVPEIFLRTIAASDMTRVSIPFDKVLTQFASLQVRSDQHRDEGVPQMETPILQATIEDTKKFGTKMQPVEASSSPAVPMKTATAGTIASAEPEAVVKEISGLGKTTTARAAVKLSPSTETKPEKTPFPLQFKTAAPPPPLKMPFQFPPNGTGAPASERVPASSGPPVPPLSPPPPSLKSTPREPSVDKIQQPPPEVKPEKKQVSYDVESEDVKDAVAMPAASSGAGPITLEIEDEPSEGLKFETAAPKVAQKIESIKRKDDEGATITIALKPIFENIPILQREGDISSISATAEIKFPLELVQSQLASGRVLIPSKTFQRALPPNYRPLFLIDKEETPVSLPLQEVLKNLPSNVLKVREDQQRFLPTEDFVTPFSLAAKEDAGRLQPAKTTEPPKKEAGGAPVEKKIDSKEVVTAACKLPGVAAVEFMFPDGLTLSGNLPSDLAIDGLCAMAPTLLQRIETHMSETKLGPLAALTVQARDSAVTFLTAKNMCLAALHKDAGALTVETRGKLSELLKQLSQTFVKPETPHVDH